MKKILPILFVVCLMCVTAAGCADRADTQEESYIVAEPDPALGGGADAENAALLPGDAGVTGQDPPAPGGSADAENAALPPGDAGVAERDSLAPEEGVDVDLTALSSTMVFAEVYNIMVNPDDYVGRTIKMSGPYYAFYYDGNGQYYHYVIVEDATACCRQGLEFVWNGDHSYPDDYPADNARIAVVGVFDSYDDLGNTYYHLVADDIVVL
jgi:hypothetical protein